MVSIHITNRSLADIFSMIDIAFVITNVVIIHKKGRAKALPFYIALYELITF